MYDLEDATDIRIAGGKAANLAKLLHEGVPVPAGFVVTSEVLTPELKELVLSRFDKLDVPYVAVRSSALNEDGTAASWAGQLETFLNVDRDSLLQEVAECLESVNSARAQAYAAQKDIAAGRVAVLVQAMVPSEVSGVAFSVHPVTQSSEQMVIEAGLGLGEAVVSGEITPDTYVVSKNDASVLEQHIASQNKRLIRGVDGGNEWETLETANDRPKLDSQQIAELATMVIKIEQYFGFPVDVEWAYAGGKLYILQSRPITTIL